MKEKKTNFQIFCKFPFDIYFKFVTRMKYGENNYDTLISSRPSYTNSSDYLCAIYMWTDERKTKLK